MSTSNGNNSHETPNNPPIPPRPQPEVRPEGKASPSPGSGTGSATGKATATATASKSPPNTLAAARAAARNTAPGLSGLSESSLEQSVIRRGLATPEEVEACKAHRAKLASAGSGESTKNLLEIMVSARVLTQGQAQRLFRELSRESQRKLEIPGYQIMERLGKGQMGIVYKARQTSVDRVVAVKVLLEALAQNKEFVKRFEREAKIAAKLNHPNIVNAIDAGEINGLYYFVMEYVEGITIKDELDNNKIYDEKEALTIVLAVARAMKHADEKGLIHRDIKPENVILTKDGSVKLADLGLARLTADEKWAAAEAGMAIGTPYYISPEQVRGSTDVDIRSDIYSLGATFYHMVTGRVPFSGDTPTEVMKKHVDKNVNFTPPDHLNTRLSSGLGEVIETMMARNRDNRYRTPDDLILDLEALLQGDRPIIAAQKTDALASLAEGEESDDEYDGESAVTEAEREEMAAYVNSRSTIIGALAIFLGLSVVANLLLLLIL
ncbi:hypothetical protein BH23PLA1_BH23PLA1_07490 [soil metagenome]